MKTNVLFKSMLIALVLSVISLTLNAQNAIPQYSEVFQKGVSACQNGKIMLCKECMLEELDNNPHNGGGKPYSFVGVFFFGRQTECDLLFGTYN